jgi:hypothetical protein
MLGKPDDVLPGARRDFQRGAALAQDVAQAVEDRLLVAVGRGAVGQVGCSSFCRSSWASRWGRMLSMP